MFREGSKGDGVGSDHEYSANDHVAYYKTIFEERGLRKGYFDYPPTIPYVGMNFSSSPTKILSYSSAENLTYTTTDESHDIDQLKNRQGDGIFDRHRYFRERPSVAPRFFPYVHLGPVEDGQQLLMLKFLLDKHLPGAFSDSPELFIEQISFANFGKFAVDNRSINRDYASDFDRLADSIPYVEGDLNHLQPEVVFLPSTILRSLSKRMSYILAAQPGILFVGLPQPFATNINCHLRRMVPPGKTLRLSPTIEEWCKHVAGIDTYTLLKYIDDQITIPPETFGTLKGS